MKPLEGGQSLARSSIISFVGSATSALMGFVVTFIIARLLGATGAGVVFQAMAVFTIVVSLSKFGMDSVAIWLLPRLVASDVARVRSALVVILIVATLLGVVGAVISIFGAPLFFVGDDPGARELARAVALLGWFVPVGGLALVLLAAIRGLGAVWPYVAIGSIGLSVIRPLVIAAVALLGGSAVAVSVAWAAPLTVTALVAFLFLRWEVLKVEQGQTAPEYRPAPGQLASVLRFAVPRTISAALEQSINWMQVLLVGGIAGTAAAGLYGGASRIMAAGMIVDTAIRVIVSPRFSALLHADDLGGLQALYRTTAVWLVAFSAPVYIVLGLYASTVLGWLGSGFTSGATVLVTLCIGGTAALMAGNIHSVLLMSGRSGWAAFNKTVALVVNVSVNLLLIPVLGIEGAALAFVAGQLVDAALAYTEVRRFIGLQANVGLILYALLVPLASIGIPALVIRWQLGTGLGSLGLSLVVGGVLFLGWCRLDRRRLHLGDLNLGRR